VEPLPQFTFLAPPLVSISGYTAAAAGNDNYSLATSSLLLTHEQSDRIKHHSTRLLKTTAWGMYYSWANRKYRRLLADKIVVNYVTDARCMRYSWYGQSA